MSGHLATCLAIGVVLCSRTVPVAGAVLSLRPALSAPGLGGVGNVVVSPDGRHVYATSGRDGTPGIDGPTVVVLARDASGGLSFVQVYFEGPAPGPFCGAGALAISPDGSHVYVAATCARRVRVFARDSSSGRLTPVGSEDHQDGRLDALDNLFQLAISPDGASLYTVDSGATVLGVFRRDPGSGGLTYVEGHDLHTPAGYTFPVGTMALSPDGRNLYVPVDTEDNSALHVFSRDLATGAVVQIETQHDGVNQFTSVANFRSAAVSADGRNVYTGFLSDPEQVIPVFSRDIGSGKLTLISAEPETAPISARSLAMTPEGSFIYVGGDYRLTVLRRDATSGRIARVETHDHTFGTVDGLYLIGDLVGAMGIAVSPDGLDVYTAAGNDGAIGHFRRRCGDGRRDPDEDCDDGNGRDGDGCSALCTVDPCFTCAGDPSICTPADGTPCNDGNQCTTGDRCGGGVCTGDAANEGLPCSDGDVCTAGDRCVEGACRGTAPLVCGVCETCDRRFGCVGFIRSDCHESPKVGPYGSLEMTRAAKTGRLFRWRWAAPEPWPPGDFGVPGLDPDARYTLCIYDHQGAARVRRRATLVAALRVPAGGACGRKPCWRDVPGGSSYRDASARVDGVTRLTLRGAGRRKPSLLLDAKGPGLQFRTLPLTLDATAQFTAPTDACWRADYREFTRTNSSRAFRARGGPKRPCHGRGCSE